jgi:hypothetical protein
MQVFTGRPTHFTQCCVMTYEQGLSPRHTFTEVWYMLIWLAIRTAKSLWDKLIWQNVDMLNSCKILYILFISYYLKCEIHKDMWIWTGTAFPICHSMILHPIKSEVLILVATSEHPVTCDTKVLVTHVLKLFAFSETPCSRSLLEKLTVSHLAKNYFCLLKNCPQNPVIAQ